MFINIDEFFWDVSKLYELRFYGSFGGICKYFVEKIDSRLNNLCI